MMSSWNLYFFCLVRHNRCFMSFAPRSWPPSYKCKIFLILVPMEVNDIFFPPPHQPSHFIYFITVMSPVQIYKFICACLHSNCIWTILIILLWLNMGLWNKWSCLYIRHGCVSHLNANLLTFSLSRSLHIVCFCIVRKVRKLPCL